jgi:capsular polysaccharide biosynthesis protein
MTQRPGGWRGPENGVTMSSRGEDSVEEPIEYRARLIGDALRRQSLVILAVALLGALLGYGASVARPGSYVSTATVLITALNGNPYAPGVSGQDSLVSIETESKVAVSDSVSALVAKRLGDPGDLSRLEKGVTATVPPNTQIISISFASRNAAFATAATQAYVESFLAYRADRAAAVNASQIVSLRNQQAAVQQQLRVARQKAADSGGTSAYYDQLVKTLNSTVVSLQTQINALGAQKSDAGHIIAPASTPSKTSGFGRPLYLAGGALFGLVGGIALALARQRRDDRVLHIDDIEAAGIPVIAAWGSARGQAAEATRLIRARALASPKRPTVIVVGPSRALRDQSTVAVALAESLANLGRSVVFADLAEHSEATSESSGRYGFTDLLTGRRTALRDLLVEKEANLTILPRGRAELGDAIEFLDATRLRKMIGELPHRADYVVLNAPSLTDSVGETLMEIANLSVVTVTLARTTRTELALVKSRGDDRVGACVTPRVRRRFRRAARRSRREGSAQVARPDEALTLIGDEEIPA